jgi:hypothetical protein
VKAHNPACELPGWGGSPQYFSAVLLPQNTR